MAHAQQPGALDHEQDLVRLINDIAPLEEGDSLSENDADVTRIPLNSQPPSSSSERWSGAMDDVFEGYTLEDPLVDFDMPPDFTDMQPQAEPTKPTFLPFEKLVSDERTRERIESLTAHVQRLQQQLEAVSSELSGARQQAKAALGQRDADVSRAKQECALLNAKVEQLRERDKQCVGLEELVASRDTQLAARDAELKEKAAAVDTHLATISELTERLKERDARLEAQSAEIERLNGALAALADGHSAEKSELEASHAEKMSAAEETCAALEKRVAELEEHARQAAQLAESQASLAAQQRESAERESQLSAQLAEAQSRASQLESQLEEQKSATKAIQSQLDASAQHNAALEADLRAASETIEERAADSSEDVSQVLSQLAVEQRLVEQLRAELQAVAAAAGEGEHALLLQERGRVRDLEAAQARLRGEVDAARQALAKEAERTAQLQQALDAARRGGAAAGGAQGPVSAELAAAQQHIRLLHERCTRLVQIYQGLKQRSESAQAEHVTQLEAVRNRAIEEMQQLFRSEFLRREGELFEVLLQEKKRLSEDLNRSHQLDKAHALEMLRRELRQQTTEVEHSQCRLEKEAALRTLDQQYRAKLAVVRDELASHMERSLSSLPAPSYAQIPDARAASSSAYNFDSGKMARQYHVGGQASYEAPQRPQYASYGQQELLARKYRSAEAPYGYAYK